MSKIEEAIIEFVKKYFWVVLLGLGIAGGITARVQGMAFVSDDFLKYLQPWHDTLKENTGFKGLAMDFYTYYIPYMCILAIATYLEGIDLLAYIKVISIVSEFACAAVGAILCQKLLKSSGKNRSWAAAGFLILMLSPMVILNGAYWGQCDYIYTAFALLSLLFLYSGKYTFSFILLGIAFTFKLQTIFLLPAYLLYYICNKKFSAWNFLMLPVIYMAGGLPAVIAGRPAREVFNIYFTQANLFGQLSMNTPNIWRFFPNMEYDYFYKWGIILTMAIFCLLAFIVFKNGYKLDDQSFLLVCVCSAGICVMFLPGMHERYTALYCTLAYIYFVVYDRKKLLIAAALDLITCISYFQYLFSLEVLPIYPLLAVINLGMLFYIIFETLKVLRLHHAAQETL